MRTAAAIFQTLAVVLSLLWAVLLYTREQRNKRIDRTKDLIEAFQSDDFHAKRDRFRNILSENQDQIGLIVNSDGDWKKKRVDINYILNKYEIILMLAERGYYDYDLLLELFGDAIKLDHKAAKQFIEENKRSSLGKMDDVHLLFEYIERAAQYTVNVYEPSPLARLLSAIERRTS